MFYWHILTFFYYYSFSLDVRSHWYDHAEWHNGHLWEELGLRYKQIKNVLVCVALLFSEQCRPSFPFPYLLHESWWLKRVLVFWQAKKYCNTAASLDICTKLALVKIRIQLWTLYNVVSPIFAPLTVLCIFFEFFFFIYIFW